MGLVVSFVPRVASSHSAIWPPAKRPPSSSFQACAERRPILTLRAARYRYENVRHLSAADAQALRAV
jgi:hypothetical protein